MNVESAAILYEVVIEIAPEARAAYLDWLRPHADAMLRFEGFLSASIYADTGNDSMIAVHYAVRDRAALDAYLAGPAAEMRADGFKRFGDKMKATRRILTPL